MDAIDWRECTVRKLAKPVALDMYLIHSLLESSDANTIVTKSIAQSELSYSSIVVLAYDSLRMLLEGLVLKNGYKIYNHECYVPFLKEILHKEDLAERFNAARLIRDAINYYGRRLKKEEFDAAYDNIISLITLVKEMVTQ